MTTRAGANPGDGAARSGMGPGRLADHYRDLRLVVGSNVGVRRAARKVGLGSSGRRLPTTSPVGIKLELTYRCNLSCPFCYTDSPARTREQAADLSDDEWRRVVDESLGLGVVEAVVTGGEPLLRRALTLETIERLSAAGVGVTLNTNGWFVEDGTADRLAAFPGLQANVSIDGATPELHDSVRGLAGSWERSVRAVDRLLRRGVVVRAIHVVTPANERWLPAFLEHAWLLGVETIRLTGVAPLGAAARAGSWRVGLGRLRRTVRALERQHAREGSVTVRPATLAGVAMLEDVPPLALLVRPNGAVWIESVQPFSFGNVRDEPLASCWARIRDGWPRPEAVEWSNSIDASGRPPAAHVPYLDEELHLGGSGSRAAPRPEPKGLLFGVPEPPSAGGDLAGARALIAGLALSRR
jgi:MoaA/NifB/PqqE/SkfB family radical SAM enzyme